MSERDPMRWMWRGVAAASLLLGWLFILWHNKFHVTVPVVVIGLGYLAVVATVTNLWRVGVAAVAPEDDSPEAWTRPIGAREELEKEKKTLLKAIKEAEFDHEMGKLSKADADELIRMYRARAIEVIKELDRLDAGAAGSARDQIQREVQARLAVDVGKGSKKDKRAAAAKAAAKPAEKPTAKPAENPTDKTADKKDGKSVETKPVIETKPVESAPVETEPVKEPEVETDPVKTPADDSSPEDVAAAEANTKSSEATS
jgi:hypothetical protein